MTSPVLWRRKWEQNTNAICSELSQGRIWVSCFSPVGLWPSVSFSSCGSGPGWTLLTEAPGLLELQDGKCPAYERLSGRAVCSSWEIWHQSLCTGSGGTLLWDPPLDGGIVILGRLHHGGGLSQWEGKDFHLQEGKDLGCEGHQRTVLGSQPQKPNWP